MSKGPLEHFGEVDIETPWFSGEPSLYCGAFGANADADLAVYRASVRQRFPPGVDYRAAAARLGSVPASNDSPVGEAERLRLIGRTRDIERYVGETDAQYCERLAGAFPAHQSRGTPSAIILQLQAYGIPDVAIFEEYAYGITNASEYGWRFVVVLGPNYGSLGWTGCKLGSAILGESMQGLGNATPAQMSAIKRIILKWKQVFSFPLRVVFLIDEAVPMGLAQLGTVVLGKGAQARLEMGEVRELGKAKLGTFRGFGFNT